MLGMMPDFGYYEAAFKLLAVVIGIVPSLVAWRQVSKKKKLSSGVKWDFKAVGLLNGFEIWNPER